MIKVLYLYANTDRHELLKRVQSGESPDTSFYGFRHLARHDEIEASFIQINKKSYGFGGSLLRKWPLTRAAVVLVRFYRILSKQDVIVLTSSAYFFLPFLGKFILRNKKWVLINIDLSMLLRRCDSKLIQKFMWMSALRCADKIICISEAQRTDLLTRGFSSHSVDFVPLGVDKSFYQKIDAEPKFVLSIGRDIGRDMKTLIEAIQLCGESSILICSKVNMEGLENEIPSNLEVLYDQPYSVLRAYYKQAKVFVLATKSASELVGSDCPGQTAVLDTLAYGISLVATEMSWFKGYFEEGKHLVTVPPGQPKLLAEKIKLISDDVSLRERLAYEGRKLVDEKCNSESMGNSIAELILKIGRQ